VAVLNRPINAQAAVDTESKLIVTAHITQQSNDKLELEPTLKNLAALPKQLGIVTELLADSGYFSETNVNACVGEEITSYIAVDSTKPQPFTVGALQGTATIAR
jgi:molybdopterin-binding protein